MKRIIMMVLRNLPFIPMAWFKLCWYASHVDNYTEGERYALLKMIDRRANKGGNITIDAHGVENIPEESGLFFIPIIRACMMFLQSWRRVRFPFLWLQKKK